MDEKLLVFVLGAPGAGKGTQCELIVKEYGWTHISAGDLLRAQVAAGTDVGKQAQEYLQQGTMVPASMIIGMLKAALSEAQHTKVLIDGFPRVADQLAEFEAQVRRCDKALFYNVPEAVANERLLARGATSQRCDDNEATIRKRFVVFREESMQVVTQLQAQGRVAEIDAAAPKEEVFAATRAVIEQLEAGLQQRQQAAAAVTQAAAVAAAHPTAAAAAGATTEPAAAAVPVAAAAAAAAAPAAGDDVATKAGSEAAAVGAAAAAAAAAAVPVAVAAAANGTDSSAVAQAPHAVDLGSIRTPIVICGPSGVGKGTLISRLMGQWGSLFGFSVSHTTRDPRPGESHGVHYFFSERAAMQAQVDGGAFLEHAEVHGNMYGTSLAAVARVSAEGKHCVLDIDVQGAAQVRKSALGEACLFIFVAPPSHEELGRRLRCRGTESDDKVARRLANATAEIEKAKEPGLFHHVLVNDDLEAAYAELQRLIAAKVPALVLGGTAGAPAAAAADSSAAPAAAPAAPAAAAAAATAAAAGGAAAALSNGNHAAPTANGAAPRAGSAAASPTAAAAAAAPAPFVHASTGCLLDFGFGPSSGHAVAAKGMPVRQYMDATVIPVLREGLKALNAARPDDPLQFLAEFLLQHKTATAH